MGFEWNLEFCFLFVTGDGFAFNLLNFLGDGDESEEEEEEEEESEESEEEESEEDEEEEFEDEEGTQAVIYFFLSSSSRFLRSFSSYSCFSFSRRASSSFYFLSS